MFEIAEWVLHLLGPGVGRGAEWRRSQVQHTHMYVCTVLLLCADGDISAISPPFWTIPDAISAFPSPSFQNPIHLPAISCSSSKGAVQPLAIIQQTAMHRLLQFLPAPDTSVSRRSFCSSLCASGRVLGSSIAALSACPD